MLKSNDKIVDKAKIGGAVTALSRVQIQLLNSGISNEEFNIISEMIGEIKEKLVNIKHQL